MATYCFPAEAPVQPHLVCRDGYYVHPLRSSCVTGYTAQSLATVVACFEGQPLSRAAAIWSLTEGQRLALFPRVCPHCERDHHKQAEHLERIWRNLQPKAREAAVGLSCQALLGLQRVRGETPQETEHLQVVKAASLKLAPPARAKGAA